METPRSVLDLPLLFFNYISSIAFVAAPPPPPSKSGYTFVVGKYRCGNTILILIKFNSDAFSTTIRRFPLIQRNDTMRCDTGTRAPPSHDPWLLRGVRGRRRGAADGEPQPPAWARGGDYNPGNQNRPFLAVNYNARTLLVLNLSIMIDNSYNLVGRRRAIDNINCTYVD